MVNKVILIGNLGADPEVRTLEGGTKVARIRIATTERYVTKDTKERKEHTEWHTISFWRGLADVAEQYLRKGSKIYIEGRLRSREWVDENQIKRTSIEIIGDVMNMLDKREGSGSPAPMGASSAAYAATPAAKNQEAGSYPKSQPQPPMQPSVETVSGDDNDDLPF